MVRATVPPPKNPERRTAFTPIRDFLEQPDAIISMTTPVVGVYRINAQREKTNPQGTPHLTYYLELVVKYDRFAEYGDSGIALTSIKIFSMPTGPYTSGHEKTVEYTADANEIKNSDGHYEFANYLKGLIEKILKPIIPADKINSLLGF